MKKLESTLVNMVGVLVCVALIMGGILAAVNHVTEGPISLQAEKTLSDGIKEVMMSDNLKVTANDTIKEMIDNKECVFIVHKASDQSGKELGAAVESTTLGFGGNLKVLVGFNPAGEILGYTLLEHAATNEISVVRMRNPVLLEKRDYTNSRKLKPSASVEIADGVISNTYPRVGFDLRIGEYLMPYGDGGEYPDFWVEQYSIETNGVKTFVGHIELPPGCGVYRAQKEDRELGPVCFGVDTNQVFTNRLDFTRSSRDGKFLCATPLARGNEYLVFHTRVKDNGDGSMSPGHYSLMEGVVNIWGGIHFKNILFNPRPGETNLEPLPD